MGRSWIRALTAALLCLLATGAMAVDYKIVTASERGTYIQIGRDLAKFVAPDADITLASLPSAGSAENVQRLRYEQGVKFAIVQSDVYQAFLDRQAGGNAEARSLIAPLRVVMSLYNEEIYFIVRADSTLQSIHEIRDARINVGPIGSGTAMTATTLYAQMFGGPPPDNRTSFLSNEDALVRLTGDRSIDVVAVVAGQPAKLLADMKPEARQLIRLLKFDADQPSSKTALKTYFKATVRATSYPNLLTEDVPGLAVRAFLVTYDYRVGDTVNHLTRFVASLCRNFDRLQQEGHPKWREVQLALPELGRGWTYYPATSRELRNCKPGTAGVSGVASQQTAPASSRCTQQDKILGLCSKP
ncbi:MAG: TRAP-type uncharacterized transport system protein periplasmic component [Rhizobacter sp.]|nr:TRAP-type uncharacterized transport system protein periplasmic component [Rhizobacter sp.]